MVLLVSLVLLALVLLELQVPKVQPVEHLVPLVLAEHRARKEQPDQLVSKEQVVVASLVQVVQVVQPALLVRQAQQVLSVRQVRPAYKVHLVSVPLVLLAQLVLVRPV